MAKDKSWYKRDCRTHVYAQHATLYPYNLNKVLTIIGTCMGALTIPNNYPGIGSHLQNGLTERSANAEATKDVKRR